MDNLEKVRGQWTDLGEADPFWAALTYRAKRGGRWDADTFLRSGREEVDAAIRDLNIPVGPTRRALDFGCGPGRLTQALSAHFSEAVGVDISGPMVELAERLNGQYNPHADRCQFVVNDSPGLSNIGERQFDLVYCVRVLQHMPPTLALDYLAALAARVAPGGHLVVQIPLHPSWNLKGLAVRVLPRRFADRLRRMEMHGVPRREVEAVIEAAGCQVRQVTRDQAAGRGWISLQYHADR
jgi:SAM-dependent methyltransferase